MKAYIAFCKKELLEQVRTYRLIIMAAVFALFGILSPFTAKILPELLNGTDMGGGLIVTLPEATALDSWAQFFKNIGQMGMLTLIIVFCGIIANELTRGTLTSILAKGVKRHTVIFAKFTVACAVWTLSYLLSFAIDYAYTVYFWGNDPVEHALLTFASPWVYGLFLLSLLILGGVLFKTLYGSLLSTGGVVLILSLLSIKPEFQKYNPISLASGTLGLLDGQKSPHDFTGALIICATLIVVCLAASVLTFDKKEL